MWHMPRYLLQMCTATHIYIHVVACGIKRKSPQAQWPATTTAQAIFHYYLHTVSCHWNTKTEAFYLFTLTAAAPLIFSALIFRLFPLMGLILPFAATTLTCHLIFFLLDFVSFYCRQYFEFLPEFCANSFCFFFSVWITLAFVFVVSICFIGSFAFVFVFFCCCGVTQEIFWFPLLFDLHSAALPFLTFIHNSYEHSLQQINIHVYVCACVCAMTFSILLYQFICIFIAFSMYCFKIVFSSFILNSFSACVLWFHFDCFICFELEKFK